MDDVQKTFFGAQAGQPGGSSGGSQEQAPQSGGEPLTEQRLRQVMAEEMDKYARAQQSQRDMLEARMRKEVQQAIDLVKSTGVEVDENKARAIQQQVTQRIMNESQSSSSAQGPAQGGAQDGTSDPVFEAALTAAQELMAEVGIEINKTDPEASTINFTTPAKFLSTVRKAIDAKRERLQREGGARASVNTPGMSSGQGMSPNLMNEYKKEVAANRGDMRAIIAIKQKYRKLGLKLE